MYNLKFNKILDYTTAYKTAFREKAGKPKTEQGKEQPRTAREKPNTRQTAWSTTNRAGKAITAKSDGAR